jgi:hypothetical protein
MSSTSQKSAVASAAACLLAAHFAVSGLVWDPLRDGLTDDLISPWCQIGSTQSWEGRPCVVSTESAATEGTASTR